MGQVGLEGLNRHLEGLGLCLVGKGEQPQVWEEKMTHEVKMCRICLECV